MRSLVIRAHLFSNHPSPAPSPQKNKSIFQLFPDHREVPSIVDVRDVYEICEPITSQKSKEAVYEMYGLDGPAVEKYLPIVEEFYRMYQYEPLDVKKKVFSFGPISIYWNL